MTIERHDGETYAPAVGMSEWADAAVVGGGAIGLAVARALAAAGVEWTVLLEREPAVGQGSTARANGGVRAQFTTPVNIAFSTYSIEEFERLQREHGDLLSFHQVGYLFVTASEVGEAQLRAAMNLQRSLDVDTEWLTPEEIADKAPFLRLEGLRGGTFHARDGFLDPHGAVQTFRAECPPDRVSIRTDVVVTGVLARAGSIELTTSAGELKVGWVVDAAGPYAAHVAAMIDVDLPVKPVRRNLAFVRTPEEPTSLIPMCIDVDTGVLVRREVGGGYVIAYSNPDDPPGWDSSLDPRFLEDLGRLIGNRFPTLRDVPFDPRQCWAGLYPETPDHHAIIGPAEEADRFIICAGFGGHGLMHAPAAGKAVAELITEGTCSTFDLHALRPSRFREGDLVMESAVL
jgi:sarcosine oxidase subunit beta